MKAIHMLAIAMIFGIALLAASDAGMDKKDIVVLYAVFAGLLPVMAQTRRGKTGCCIRRMQGCSVR